MKPLLGWMCLAVAGLAAAACSEGPDALRESHYEFHGQGWEHEDSLGLTYTPPADAPDSLTLWAFFELNEDFPYQNLHFTIRVDAPGRPDSVHEQQFILMNPKGEWFTEATWRGTYPFRGRLIPLLQLPATEESRLWVKHNMRKDTLPGLESFDLVLTPHAPPPPDTLSPREQPARRPNGPFLEPGEAPPPQ